MRRMMLILIITMIDVDENVEYSVMMVTMMKSLMMMMM